MFAQPIVGHFFSIGVKGGGAFTKAYSDFRAIGVDTSVEYFSESKDYVVGPLIEVRLPGRFSVEADGLYRPLHQTAVLTLVPNSSTFTTRTINHSWEFPILAKYRLSSSPIRPYLDAGPSFRIEPTFPSDTPHPSRKGFTAGGGVEMSLWLLKISPEIRYTRWGADANQSVHAGPLSNQNQAEFLLGIAF